MKKIKRAITFLLATLVLLSVIPQYDLEIKAHAAYVVESGSCGDKVIYKLDSDGLLTISGSGDMYDMKNFREHFSGDCTPWDKDEIKWVIIENGVTGIGKYTFSDHYELSGIQIADSVVSIGEGAFQYCGSLTSLILPKNLAYIPKAMCSLAELRYIYIPATVTEIGNGAFYSNELIEVEFGGTQSQWENVSIDYNNENIAEAYMVYEGSNALSSTQSGNCGDNVTWKLTTDGTLKISGNGNMDSYAEGAVVDGYFERFAGGADHPWFKYRSKIKKIIIDSGVASVGAYAFFDCFNCTSLEIKNGVKIIQDGAFAYMPISSVLIPDSVTTLGKYVFNSCGALQQVTLSKNITVLDDQVFEYCSNLKPPVLPEGLTRINYSAFYGSQFDVITIPATVTYIGPNFAHVDRVDFLGETPSFSLSGPPAYLLTADYWYCRPEHYESYKEVFVKWRADGVLSDGSICAKLNKTEVTLTNSDPVYQLTVSDETDSATSLSKKWWLEKSEVASVDQNGVVTATGHGKTMLYAEISANGYHSVAGCNVSTKRNDLLVALLPENIEADFPVSCGTQSVPFGEVDAVSYLPGKLKETDTSNQYYQELLSLTNDLTADCSTDKQKAKAIFTWVSENITYGGAIGIGTTVDQVYAVYMERKAHCEGFAKLTGFMLYLADIPSCLVASFAHMWNIALLDGEWTMIDSTNKEFGFDYNDCSAIEWIGFGTDDLCFAIDSTEGIKLAGVGNRYLTEEREKYTSIGVPDFVDIIFGNAFGLCANLKSVTLPKNVKKIRVDAFEGCDNLTDVYYVGSEMQWNKIHIEEGNENLLGARITFGAVLTGIAVETMPTKTTYFVGESFDQSGLTLSATYSDGSIQTIESGFTCTGFKSSTAGTKTVTVSYGAKSVTFTVSVQAIPVTDVNISETAITLVTGATKQLTAIVVPANATNKAVIWSSSNSSIATVSADGFITAVDPGVVTVKATTVDGNKTAECTVTVQAIPVTDVNISETAITLVTGATKQLTATVVPANATNKAVIWSSSNSSIATVSADGFVTAVAPGVVTVKVTTSDGNKTAECKATVFDVIPTVSITTPSTKTIKYGDSIVLHANMNKELQSGWKIKWFVSNGNFSFEFAGDASSCTLTPAKSGDTTVTVILYDAEGNEVSKDEQTLTSKAGFFDKIIAFFKKLFGLTKVYDQY